MLENKWQLMETMVGKKKLRGPLQRLLILTPTGGLKMFAPSMSSPCMCRFSSRHGLTAYGDAGLASAEPSCPAAGQRGDGRQTSLQREMRWYLGGVWCRRS